MFLKKFTDGGSPKPRMFVIPGCAGQDRIPNHPQRIDMGLQRANTINSATAIPRLATNFPRQQVPQVHIRPRPPLPVRVHNYMYRDTVQPSETNTQSEPTISNGNTSDETVLYMFCSCKGKCMTKSCACKGNNTYCSEACSCKHHLCKNKVSRSSIFI